MCPPKSNRARFKRWTDKLSLFDIRLSASTLVDMSALDSTPTSFSLLFETGGFADLEELGRVSRPETDNVRVEVSSNRAMECAFMKDSDNNGLSAE